MDLDDEEILYCLNQDPRRLRDEGIMEDLDDEYVRRAAERLAKKGNYIIATEGFTWLSNDERLRRLAHTAFDEGKYDAAQIAVERIDDIVDEDMALLESIADRVDTLEEVHDVLEYNSDRLQAVQNSYQQWSGRFGYEDPHCPSCLVSGLAAMARDLSQEFDVVVGVPRGGLLPAFIFDVFGCDVGLLEYHRDRDDPPVWVTDVDVRGRHVLVVDKDVVSGDTLATAQGFLDGERGVSAAFMLNAYDGGGIGSCLSNVPDVYDAVFVPDDFDDYMDGFKSLEKRL